MKRLETSGIATEDGSEYYNKDYLKDFLHNYYKSLQIKKPFKSQLRNAQYADFFIINFHDP